MGRFKTGWTYLCLIAVSGLFSLPLLLMISGSLKSREQLLTNPNRLFDGFQFSNYAQALEAMPFALYLSNTLVLCLGSVVGVTLSCALVAYGLTHVRWPGRPWVFATVLLTMLLPWHITMIPRFVLISKLGFYNSFWSLIAPTFLGDAFFIFLLRQFFLTIPNQLLEAGRVDGLSHWGLFWQLVLPLSKPALATVALFQFVNTWNDFGGPLLYLSDPQKFPLAYGLERFVSAYSGQTNLLLAAAVLFTLPIVVLFFLTQKTFIQGISTTGLKG